MRGQKSVLLVQAHHPLTVAVLLLALATGVLAGCAPFSQQQRPGYPSQPGPSPRPSEPPAPSPSPYGYHEGSGYPRGPEAVSGPAVLNLLAQARADTAAGQPDRAMSSLETALNIEPRNPFVWQQMAVAHLAQHLPDQAEHQAQRSNSFAHGNPYIEVENWRIIAAARQERGDLTGARTAREKMAELQGQLESP